MMDWLWGPPTPSEIAKKVKRNIDRSIRVIEREKDHFTDKQKSLLKEIKKEFSDNKIDTAKVLARSLIRTRANCKRIDNMRCKLMDLSDKVAIYKSVGEISNVMKEINNALIKMNKSMKIDAIDNLLDSFAEENTKIEDVEKTMDKYVDKTLEVKNEDEEGEELIQSIFDELGLEIKINTVHDPLPSQQQKKSDNDMDLKELQTRFDNLIKKK